MEAKAEGRVIDKIILNEVEWALWASGLVNSRPTGITHEEWHKNWGNLTSVSHYHIDYGIVKVERNISKTKNAKTHLFLYGSLKDAFNAFNTYQKTFDCTINSVANRELILKDEKFKFDWANDLNVSKLNGQYFGVIHIGGGVSSSVGQYVLAHCMRKL